ncbi:hypothetical protein HD554DRAFT_2178424 [Boletus coccyginus]|nr:hypothetical protein HD554DRAFT_2178424 [Boletus coccyginus]
MDENISMYELPASPGNSKVQRFCELSCPHGRSIWSTRGWTYQKCIASKVVQFYTEDRKPYLVLDIFNRKESPIIISEMEQAMNIASQGLAILQPDLDRVSEKEKPYPSGCQTTREEDSAYSLFDIFEVPIPVVYGEGNHAVGRLLDYLPVDLTVYKEIVPHVPAEMDEVVMALRSSLPDLSLAMALYERLHNLPPLSFPGIASPVTDLVPLSESESESDLPIYRATSPIVGDVEIKTMAELSGVERLLLIHPGSAPSWTRISRAAPPYLMIPRALCGSSSG